MALTLTLKFEGGDKAAKVLGELALKAEDVPALLRGVGDGLVSVTLRRFVSQSDPSGKAWAKLAPLTIAIRGDGGRILTRAGTLRGSVSAQVHGHALHLGANTKYAAIQQFGGTIKAKNPTGRLWIPTGGKKGGVVAPQSVTLPARPYIGFGADDESKTREMIKKYFGSSKA
jgi:phage gpG-like protein